MWKPIIKQCDINVCDPMDIEKVSYLTNMLSSCFTTYHINANSLPYGRYLLYQNAQCSYHIELHIFSQGYQGAVHCHETWGIFWLISGTLFIENFIMDHSKIHLNHSGWLNTYSGLNFCPPHSDWHRVSTPTDGSQTVSIHIYGEKYNIAEGKYIDAYGKICMARRGNFQDNQYFISHLYYKKK